MTAVVANRQRKVPVNTLALRQAALLTLRMEGAPQNTEISIAVTDDSEIRDLNRRYLGKNQPTDVLAFPLGPTGAGGRPRVVARRIHKGRLGGREIGERLLGEIVLSAERAAAQAAEYGNSVRREMELLVIHGVLHLLGYDDTQPRAKRAMEARQAAILDARRKKKS